MDRVVTILNPDLEVVEGKGRWNHSDNRRSGFHNLYQLARYTLSFRAARVMQLTKRMDTRIADLDAVQRMTSLPSFSAMVVILDQHILYERYAPDFDRHSPHSIQSITKTTMNLIVGQLVEREQLDLSSAVARYIPEIGSGYANATIQHVLNMDVVNDYSEDFSNAEATYYRHEEAMGWRLPPDPAREETQREFLTHIESADTTNRTGHAQYKCANCDVLAWVAERASGRQLRAFLAEIVDAAGLEDAFHITTDRDGFPCVDGGACLTARDLARYFSIFVRKGKGVGGETVGNAAFIHQTLRAGVPMSPPNDWVRYSNCTMVWDQAIGHGGWGGQYAVANLETGVVGVFFSVVEDQNAIGRDYQAPIMRMLKTVVSMEA